MGVRQSRGTRIQRQVEEVIDQLPTINELMGKEEIFFYRIPFLGVQKIRVGRERNLL